MQKTIMHNPTGSNVEFTFDGNPAAGSRPQHYVVPPGRAVEVPLAYVQSGAMAKIAPGLIHGPPPNSKPQAAPKPAPAGDADAGKAAALAAATADDDGTPDGAPEGDDPVQPEGGSPDPEPENPVQALVDAYKADQLRAMLDEMEVSYTTQANKTQLATLIVNNMGAATAS